MRKAFVTGGTGFLGINLIRALIKEGWEVTALVLPGESIFYLEKDRINFVRGDIMNLESLRKAIPDVGDVTVFHVAGLTSMWHKQDKIQYNINVIGTRNVCQVSLEKSVRKLVFTSSISAYGYHSCRVNEDTVSNALTCKMNYNMTKYLAEKEVRKGIRKGLDAVILNPCNIIGPYDIKGWATLIRSANRGKLKGATSGMATFAHVEDVVYAHINAADKGGTGENYLLGGVEVSFKEVNETICKMLNKKPPQRTISPLLLKTIMVLLAIKSLFDRKMPLVTYPRYKRLVGNIVCDDSKARKVLGYQSRPLEEMLQESYNWLRQEDLL